MIGLIILIIDHETSTPEHLGHVHIQMRLTRQATNMTIQPMIQILLTTQEFSLIEVCRTFKCTLKLISLYSI
jgi:hypothetical protein